MVPTRPLDRPGQTEPPQYLRQNRLEGASGSPQDALGTLPARIRQPGVGEARLEAPEAILTAWWAVQ